MTESTRAVRVQPTAIVDRWRIFWFRPEPAYPLGLIRIAFGAIVVAWTVSLLPDLYDLFGGHGVAPHQPAVADQWGVFKTFTSDQALFIGWVVLLVCAVALTVGWHSRLAALAVFVLIVSFEYRDPSVFNSGDNLIRIEALILVLSPCGAALSLDQRRSTGSFWSAQTRAVWPLRLLQIQLSLIYLATFQIRLSGHAWPQGTALSYALRLSDMLILPSPHWLTTNALLMNAATWGAMLLELSIGILVWNRRLRPWVLAAGVVLHSTIMITVAVGFFTPAMFVLYLAFVPADTVRRLPGRIKDVGATSLSLLRRHRPRANVGQNDMHERREVDSDSSTAPPARTPSDRITAAEPRADETVATSLNTNGADRVGQRMQLAEQQPPAIADVARHGPLASHKGLVSFTNATSSPRNTPPP
jgi:Vitamin K-dependent gamma-carboxylase